MPLFRLGTLEITPGASAALAAVGADSAVFLARHQHGDWGEQDDDIRQENDFAIRHNQAIFSKYKLSDDRELVVMTEADRSCTRMFLAAEYPFRKVSTQKGYELWAASYDTENNALIAVEEPRVEALLARLPVATALDVGTGTGRYALKLARLSILMP